MSYGSLTQIGDGYTTGVPNQVQLQPDGQTPPWRLDRVECWKGDRDANGKLKGGGWQICMDHRRTKGKPGKVMPVLIKYPVSARHMAQAKVPGHGGLPMAVPILQAKRFKPLDDQRRVEVDGRLIHVDDLECPRELIDLLIERHLSEHIIELKSKKVHPNEIHRQVHLMTQKLYEANGIEEYDPPNGDTGWYDNALENTTETMGDGFALQSVLEENRRLQNDLAEMKEQIALLSKQMAASAPAKETAKKGK